jgi:hypothetical protein
MIENVQVLTLGTECRDKATEITGTVTHWVMNMGGRVEYLFQPRGLDEEGAPLKKLYLCRERLEVSEGNFEMVEVPFEILGSQVTDKASGFTGMATQFIRHINGCFHVEIQPKGMLPKKGTVTQSRDFDLRACVGEKIAVLTDEERSASHRERPSPSERPQPRQYD